MSQPSNPKQSFWSQLLPLLTIFLAMQLMFMACQKPADVRTSTLLLSNMRDLHAKTLDQDLVTANRSLDGVLDQELKDKKIDQDLHDKRLLEGAILTADSAMTAGEFYKQINREQQAYQQLETLYKKFRGNPLWDTYAITVPYHNKTWTPAGLYAYSVETLSVNNKKDLIYGFIPGYQVIDFLVHLTGAIPSFSYWFAAFLLALCVRTIVYPLTQRQLQWGRQMSQLQPLAKEIKEKYKDQTEQQMKTMALYKEYGLNPYAGCLPAVAQLPLFLTVYQFMLHYRFEFQKGTFLWIHEGVKDINVFNLFHINLAPNLGLQDQILIVFYGITMVISTLLTPVSDPSQATQQRIMGVGIALVFAGSMFFGAFPVASAFVLYWTFTNLLATAQSLRAYRMPLAPLQKVNASTGGVYPTRKPSFMDKLNDMMHEQMQKEQQLKGDLGAESNGADPKRNGTVIPTKPTSTTTTKSETGPPSRPRTGNPSIRRPKRRK